MLSKATLGVTSLGSCPSLRVTTMKLFVPHNDSYNLVRFILFTPKGEVTATVSACHWTVDIPLPEGVHEDEVDVYSCFLGADHCPPYGCGPALLRAATRKSCARFGSGR